jgi:hypothetical protein
LRWEVVVGRSSGRLAYSRFQTAELQREAAEAAAASQLESNVNSLLNEQLGELNARDTDLIRGYLDEIEDALRDRVEEFDRLKFGGSVAKHTHADGLSDIDSLVVLDPTGRQTESSAQVREEIADVLRQRLGRDRVESVTVGNVAVTVRYRDGTEIQLLPAMERNGRLRISKRDGEGWSEHIRPRLFTDALSELNTKQAHTVVPTIKLAKAVLAERVPEADRLSGYHIEALAMKAFETYTGPKTLKSTLTHLFESAAEHVRTPLRDVTGQSEHVDDYLGDADSSERRRVSAELSGVARTMRDTRSADDWRRLLRT